MGRPRGLKEAGMGRVGLKAFIIKTAKGGRLPWEAGAGGAHLSEICSLFKDLETYP